jgi:hypothetical protein
VDGSSRTYSAPRWLLRSREAIRSRCDSPPDGDGVGLAEPQVIQADLVDRAQRRGDRGPVGEPLQGVVDAQAEHVGYGQAVDPDGQGGVVEAGAVAGRAADGDVGQVLDVKVDVAQPAAGGALALAGIEREVPGLPAPPPGVRGLGERPADLVERPGVGRGC